MQRLYGAGFAALFCSVSTIAMADCAPDSIPKGATATCTGTDLDGFKDGSDEITVIVDSGASVFGDDARAIDIDGDDTVLVNAGTIDATGAGKDAVRGGSGFYIYNTGDILGGADGIDARAGGVTVINEGDITAVKRGLHIDDDGGVGGDDNYVENYGSIVSTDNEGIEARDRATIYNYAGALIQGYDDAVQVAEEAFIWNAGTILSTGIPGDPQDAIDIDSGEIFNTATGQIISTLDAAIDFDGSTIASIITNEGLIRGRTGIVVETDPAEGANTAAQTVINAGGTIHALDGPALSLGAGDDQFIDFSGVVIGDGLFGEGEDLLAVEGLDYADPFGGAGAIFDGGADTDTVRFTGFAFDDIAGVSLLPEGFRLNLQNAGGGLEIALADWEIFQFQDPSGQNRYAEYDEAAIRALAVAPVPLPAGMVLMLSGLGLLALRRRR
ncbi:MAG: hypothetical protein HLUCCA08_12005 [Rhodobacteraceae bacterium HLUCCA08]|nr:MAG: hypothetical protein HLUCCA08_12005 [Rhodobacteraceae bacterium HLUCCA08]